MDADIAPGEGQLRLGGSLAWGQGDGVQGGVQQRRVDRKALGLPSLLSSGSDTSA